MRVSSRAFFLGPSDVEGKDMVFFRNVWTSPVIQRHISRVSELVYCVSSTRTEVLILCKEMVTEYSENRAKRINTL
jgi:hypothetical protein